MVQNNVKPGLHPTAFGKQEGRYIALDGRRPDATPNITAVDIPLNRMCLVIRKGGMNTCYHII